MMKGTSLYRDNVALLYRHFDEYKTRAKKFFAPLPFEVKYVLTTGRRKEMMTLRPVRTPIPLGALFLCWRQYPELFRVGDSDGNVMIFSFNGSPLSGINSFAAVNLETGEITVGENAPRFMDRCRALDCAIEMSNKMLKELCDGANMKVEDFVPNSLEDVIDFVKGLEDNDM